MNRIYILAGQCRQASRGRALHVAVFLALWLAACAAERPLLNSERIEQAFGSYAVRVIASSGNLRVSSLESREDDRAVTRTLAIVWFNDAAEQPYAAEHQRIMRGASIGHTLQDAGWRIEKPRIRVGTLDVPGTAVAVGQLMHLHLPVQLAMHAYRFDIVRHAHRYHYATIVELHHPDYLGLAEVQAIYGDGPALPADADRDRLLQSRIEAVVSGLDGRRSHDR